MAVLQIAGRSARACFVAVSIVAMAMGVGDSVRTGIGHGWTEIWRDDLTTWSEWRPDNGCGWGNGAKPQAYVPDAATIVTLPGGGTAGRLTVRRHSEGDCDYTSGRRNTAESHPFTLGERPMRFTARLKMPGPGNGLWPAWWLYETNGAGGYCPDNCHEIDIVEWLGDAPRAAELHSHHPDGSYGKRYVHDQALGDALHDYAVEWNGADTITWLFDGEQVAQQTDAGMFKGREYMLILNFALLSDDRWQPHPGVDDTTPMPSALLVDSVKVETRPQ